jgi:hypothetical protein
MVDKTGLSNLLKKPFKKIQLRKAFREAMNESKDVIGNLQISQFQLGKDAEGGSLPPYSNASVEIYGKRPGPWTLKDKGDFYKGLKVKVGADETVVTSTDSKTAMLEKKVMYHKEGDGGEIFGLTKESKQSLGALLMGDFGPGILAEKVKRNLAK